MSMLSKHFDIILTNFIIESAPARKISDVHISEITKKIQ